MWRERAPDYRRFVYSDFRLFNVDAAQNIQPPKGSYCFINLSDQEIRGVLTVIPKEGTRTEPISLEIVVPAQLRVYKVVGPGRTWTCRIQQWNGHLHPQWKRIRSALKRSSRTPQLWM